MNAQRFVALCAGCAAEAGGGSQQAERVDRPDFNGACEHCGAILVGFFYRMPETADSGMSPGAG